MVGAQAKSLFKFLEHEKHLLFSAPLPSLCCSPLTHAHVHTATIHSLSFSLPTPTLPTPPHMLCTYLSGAEIPYWVRSPYSSQGSTSLRGVIVRLQSNLILENKSIILCEIARMCKMFFNMYLHNLYTFIVTWQVLAVHVPGCTVNTQ